MNKRLKNKKNEQAIGNCMDNDCVGIIMKVPSVSGGPATINA